MSKSNAAVSSHKAKRKEIMAQIFNKLSDAIKDYATPKSEKKIEKKLKKTSKALAGFATKKTNSH